MSEAIEVDENGSSSKLAITTPTAAVLLSSSVLKAMDVESIAFHGLGKTITISSDDSTPSAQSSLVVPTDVLSREELNVMLECFPTFIEMKPPTFHMNELFSVLERIPVDVTIELS